MRTASVQDKGSVKDKGKAGMRHNKTVSFGFKDIPESEKTMRVGRVFSSVATRYDVMNDLMSGGVHRLWKAVLMDRLNPQPGQHLLDVAGGTGDVAVGFLTRADHHLPVRRHRPHATATICDINADMLAASTTRKDVTAFADRITHICADAMNLPFPDKYFNVYTISFGIRNVTDLEVALHEAHRVLKPGGKFYCLEFSHPVTHLLQKAYDAYSFTVIPWLGEKVAHDRESYQYLVESIRRFPAQEAFAGMIRRAGFACGKVENLSGGIAALHSGWRLLS